MDNVNHEEICNCYFCKFLQRFSSFAMMRGIVEVLKNEGLDSKYIMRWGLPLDWEYSFFKNPRYVFTYLLPFLAKEYNVNVNKFDQNLIKKSNEKEKTRL